MTNRDVQLTSQYIINRVLPNVNGLVKPFYDNGGKASKRNKALTRKAIKCFPRGLRK